MELYQMCATYALGTKACITVCKPQMIDVESCNV